jgi:hypothetical protein
MMWEVVGPRERAPPQESRFWGGWRGEAEVERARRRGRNWVNILNEWMKICTVKL